METIPITVMIYAYQAARLDLLKKRRKSEELATVEALVNQGNSRKQARIIAARMRRVEWPGVESAVAGAVERRLAEPDLAGPWSPLTEAEAAELALSGRWPGPDLGVYVSQRNYRLPSDLVTRLRTAAWRVSKSPLARLYELGLVGSGRVLTAAQRQLRDDLAEQLYPVPRIVREALARYPPT